MARSGARASCARPRYVDGEALGRIGEVPLHDPAGLVGAAIDDRLQDAGVLVLHLFQSTRQGARPNLAVFRSLAKTLPFEMTLLEKHPCSTQAFLPMVCTRYLVCVAPALADGSPDVERLRAFRCGPGVGINYRRDVWHHPILALDGPADFAMLAWEDGSPQDCVEWPLRETLLITE